MHNPKISIIIPCYNVAEYLPKCLDSVINQTYSNLEIICVNDGSSDNSMDILNDYKSKDDRIIIINQENAGASEARNNGLKYVTGEYIMFIDGDDWIELNTCEKAINIIVDKNADIVIWNYISEHPNNPVLKHIFKNDIIFFDSDNVKTILRRRFFGLYQSELAKPENADSIVTIWGKLYKSNLIIDNNIRFVDLKEIGTSEDALFNIEVFKYVNSAVYIPYCLYHYRKDNIASLTSNYKEKLFFQWQHLFDLIEEYIRSNALDESYTEALNNRICLSIIGLGLNIMDADKSVNKVKEIKKIISSERYRKAYKQLTLKYFPIHWKIFFACAKYNFAFGVFILLKAIKILIGK